MRRPLYNKTAGIGGWALPAFTAYDTYQNAQTLTPGIAAQHLGQDLGAGGALALAGHYGLGKLPSYAGSYFRVPPVGGGIARPLMGRGMFWGYGLSNAYRRDGLAGAGMQLGTNMATEAAFDRAVPWLWNKAVQARPWQMAGNALGGMKNMGKSMVQKGLAGGIKGVQGIAGGMAKLPPVAQIGNGARLGATALGTGGRMAAAGAVAGGLGAAALQTAAFEGGRQAGKAIHTNFVGPAQQR